MKKKLLLIIGAVTLYSHVWALHVFPECYSDNRYPLVRKPYMELPLGSIKAKGWLLEMLQRQRNGASSQMDVLYPEVMGTRNGWLGETVTNGREDLTGLTGFCPWHISG